jgi:hypothetical protein
MPDLKVLNGRVPTEADAETEALSSTFPIHAALPIFFDHPLPLRARLRSPEVSGIEPPGNEVVIVQAEIGDNGEIVIGLQYCEDEEAVCTLEELEILGPIE